MHGWRFNEFLEKFGLVSGFASSWCFWAWVWVSDRCYGALYALDALLRVGIPLLKRCGLDWIGLDWMVVVELDVLFRVSPRYVVSI
jgi:hypothetical protein